MTETAEQIYRNFLASIDTSVAGRDQYGDLRWHVECSAEANATDMQQEKTTAQTTDGYYAAALSTAKICLDDWESYYPQLRLDRA